MDRANEEPVALEKEIQFILDTAGLRPLAAPRSEGTKTKEISRSHKLIREKSGLITIIGGKWATARAAMAMAPRVAAVLAANYIVD